MKCSGRCLLPKPWVSENATLSLIRDPERRTRSHACLLRSGLAAHTLGQRQDQLGHVCFPQARLVLRRWHRRAHPEDPGGPFESFLSSPRYDYRLIHRLLLAQHSMDLAGQRPGVGLVHTASPSFAFSRNTAVSLPAIGSPLVDQHEHAVADDLRLLQPQVASLGLLLEYLLASPEDHWEDHQVDLVDEVRSEEHTSELQSRQYLVCRLLLENKKDA